MFNFEFDNKKNTNLNVMKFLFYKKSTDKFTIYRETD